MNLQGITRTRGRARLGPASVTALAWVVATIVVAVLRWPMIDDPPVWDVAMGMFPAAIFLEESGFDIASLLQQPGFSSGGPNSHALSPITWLTAGVLRFFPDSALAVLHLIGFMIGGIALVGVHRLARMFVPEWCAVLLVASVLLHPTVLVQMGYAYLEIPLMAAAVWCAVFVAERQRWPAIGAALVAVAVKPTGLFIVPILLLLSAGEHVRLISRMKRSAADVSAPLFLVLVLFIASPEVALLRSSVSTLLLDDWHYLRQQWDLSAMWIVFLVLMLRDVGGKSGVAKSSRKPVEVVDLPALAFAGLFLLLPLGGMFLPLLTRYYVVVFPFLILSIAVRLASLRHWLAAIFLGAMMLISVFNREGDLYPSNDVFDIAIIERSDAYRHLLEIQIASLSIVQNSVPPSVPVVYGLFQSYAGRLPAMRYVRDDLANGRSVWTEADLGSGRIECYPERFVLIHDFAHLGGEAIKQVWDAASAEAGTRVDVTEISSGQFRGYVVAIDRSWVSTIRPIDCPES